MEWNNELSLKLIDEYEKFPILWDSKHPLHYARNKKLDAWDEMAKNIAVNVAEVKQKINSLLGSLRREKAKGKRSTGTGKGAEEVYVSKWFAFKRMEFLLYKNEPVGTVNTEESNDNDSQTNVDEDDDSQADQTTENFENSQISFSSETDAFENKSREQTEQTEASENRANEEVIFPKPPKQKKRKINKNQNEARTEEAYRILKETVATPREPTPDSHSIYGVHVANKLRTYSNRTRVEVENAINQILYAADIGKYDVSITNRPQSPPSVHALPFISSSLSNCDSHSSTPTYTTSSYDMSDIDLMNL